MFLENIITMLAPIMPFITEELYHNCKHIFESDEDSIHNGKYPQSIKLDGIDSEYVVETMDLILLISKQILSTLGQLGVGNNQTITFTLTDSPSGLQGSQFMIETLTNTSYTETENEVFSNAKPGISQLIQFKNTKISLNLHFPDSINIDTTIKTLSSK